MLGESAPSTVIYRKEGNRTSLKQLIDSVAANEDGILADDAACESPGRDRAFDSEDNGKQDEKPAAQGGQLGWMQGVFIPCLLNIWGVIMFLRLGWVVGQAGIVFSCLIILCSKVVTTITTLSLCAITTNGEVKGGGVYFLISRALGPIFGGTIGILFFLAQAVATSLYVIGFAESIVFLIKETGGKTFTGSEINDLRIIGIGTTVVLLCVALIGVGWYAKCQVGLLVTLVIAMLSVLIGSFLPAIPDELDNSEAGFVGYSPPTNNWWGTFILDPATPSVVQNFFTVFSVFFPAATGIMAGANLSGDLKDPSNAIPKGTLLAIMVTFVSYIGLVFIVGGSSLICSDAPGQNYCDLITDPVTWAAAIDEGKIPAGGLIFNKLIMQNVSVWSPLFYLGVFAATLSSALASLVGAPRILQSVASDELFPWPWFNYFGKGHGANNEPVRAYFLTFFIAVGCVAIGKLDVIAPLISNFFMLSYAFTNYACFASSFANYPGWRPSFKYYNKWLSLFGFILCIVVMFLMDYVTTLVTLALAFALYAYLWHLDPSVDWGPAGTARLYFSTLRGLEKLQALSTDHVKTYRPQYLVLCGPPAQRSNLVKFAALLSKGGGITICGDVILSSEIDTTHKDSNVSRVVDTRGLVRLEGISEDAVFDDDIQNEAHHELAAKLATRLAAVNARRKTGDEYLANKRIWTKRCPHAFFESVVSDTLLQGFESLLETGGVGKMRSNVVVIGFKADWQNVDVSVVKEWESMVRITLASDLGLVVLRDDQSRFDIDMTTKRRFNSVASAVEAGRDPNSADDDVASDSTSLTSHGTDTQSKPSGNAGENVAHVSPVRVEAPTNASTTISGEFVDVWWIADDGGLTILLPFLLSQHRQLRGNKKLRVFTITNYNTDETSRLQKTEFRMIHLLQKLRIEAQVIGVEANLGSQPGLEITKEFEDLGAVALDALTADEKSKTNRVLRLSELLREQTDQKSATVFMTLPLPDTGMPVKLFTSWLHVMSTGIDVPMAFIRGSGEKVVTFVC